MTSASNVMSGSIEAKASTATRQSAGLAGRRVRLLLAATLAVMSNSAAHAYLSETDRPEQIIQIGASASEAEAQGQLRAARQYAQPLLNNAREYIEPVDKGSKRLYRARFALDSNSVKSVCEMLKKANMSCIAVSPTAPTDAAPAVVTPASARPARTPSASPQARTAPPQHQPSQPKSIWQAVKDTSFLGNKSR